MSIPIESFLSTTAEWHNFVLGLSTGAIAAWLQDKTSLGAALVVVVATFAVYAQYSSLGAAANPWYFTSPLGVVVVLADLWNRVRNQFNSTAPAQPADSR